MMMTGTVSKRMAHHNQNQVMDIATTCVMLKTYHKHKPTDSELRSTEEESCAIRHTNRAAKIEQQYGDMATGWTIWDSLLAEAREFSILQNI
jgi:hypothetical protein